MKNNMNNSEFLKFMLTNPGAVSNQVDRRFLNSLLADVRQSPFLINELPSSLADLYDFSIGTDPLDISYFVDHFEELPTSLRTEIAVAFSKLFIAPVQKKQVGKQSVFEFSDTSNRKFMCDFKHFDNLVGNMVKSASQEHLQNFSQNPNGKNFEILLAYLSINNSALFENQNASFINSALEQINLSIQSADEDLQADLCKTLVAYVGSIDANTDYNAKLILELYSQNILPLSIVSDKIKNFSLPEIVDMYSANLLSKEAIQNIVSSETLIETYLSKRDDRKTKNYAKQVLSCISPQDLIKSFLSDDENRIDIRALKSSGITSESITYLDTDLFFRFLNHPDCPKELIPSSDDLIVMSLLSPNKDKFIELAQKGLIEPQDIIRVSAYGSLDAFADYNVKRDLLDFYTPQVLLSMNEKGTLTEHFTNLYKTRLMPTLSTPEEKEEFYLGFVSNLSEVSKSDEEFGHNLINLYELGLMDPLAVQIAAQNDEFILESFLTEQTSENTIFKLFEDRIITRELLSTIFSDDEIAQAYSEGKLSSAIFEYAPKENLIPTLHSFVDKGLISFEEIFNLYLSNPSLDVKTLIELKTKIEEKEQLEKSISVYELLPENCSHDKIKELYTSYVLDHDSLIKLFHNGTISKQEFDEFSELISKQEFFQKLANTRVVSNYASSETGEHRPHMPPAPPGTPSEAKIDVEAREYAFSALGALDNQPRIVGGALDGYRMVGIPELDVVILEKFEVNSRKGMVAATNNATYILPYQQAEYYSRNSNKSDLRDADCVITVNHTKNWAQNLVKGIIELNPKTKEKLKSGKSYTDEVQSIIDDIRKNYEDNTR